MRKKINRKKFYELEIQNKLSHILNLSILWIKKEVSHFI